MQALLDVWKRLFQLKRPQTIEKANRNMAKMSAKQLRSEVINALASVYCYYLRATKTAEEEEAIVVSC